MMEQAKAMTVEDVLVDVMGELERLRPSMADYETVVIPVANAMRGIRLVLDTFAREKAKLAAKQNGGEADDHGGGSDREIPAGAE